MTATDQILKMQNPIQSYAWGSHTAIAKLMGKNTPTHRPEAELWMGAHPHAPSSAWYKDRWQPLDQIIAQFPEEMLGTAVAGRFSNQLPYLLKVLAVDKPLSIQAHPDKHQAEEGFQKENTKSIALDSPFRNYKDDHHKPECLCALTQFWGLCGFRSLAEMLLLIAPVWPLRHRHVLTVLKNALNPDGLQRFFHYLMGLDERPRKEIVARIVANTGQLKNQCWAYDWIIKLNKKFPGDIGVLSPLLLNVIKLEPGEALFLPSRQLHAYLCGLGIELMANSDNVLRCGLTVKHIDLPELIKILDFTPRPPEILTMQVKNATESVFPSPAEEFTLAELVCDEKVPHRVRHRKKGPEIILCIDGSANISWMKNSGQMRISHGQSVFVPSIVDNYTIRGNSRLYKVTANL